MCLNVVKTALIYSVVTLYLGLRPRIKFLFGLIWPILKARAEIMTIKKSFGGIETEKVVFEIF